MLETISCHIIDLDKLSTNPVIVDAGACIGEFTNGLITKLGGKGKYYCVECDNRNYSELKKLPNNVVPIYGALVGDEDQKVATCYADNHLDRREWSNIFNLYADHPAVKDTSVLDDSVPAITIKKLVNMYNLHIDYLKMDVEGVEFDVLKNMPNELLVSIPQISFEYHKLKFTPLNGAKRNKAEYRELDENFYILKDYLEGAGFKLSLHEHNEVYCTR